MIDWLLKSIDGLFLGYTIRFKANGYENKRKTDRLVDRRSIKEKRVKKKNNTGSSEA